MNKNLQTLIPFNGLLFFFLIKGLLRLFISGWREKYVLLDYLISAAILVFFFWFLFNNKQVRLSGEVTNGEQKLWRIVWRSSLYAIILDCSVGMIGFLSDYRVYTTIIMCLLCCLCFFNQVYLYRKGIL